MIHRYKRDAAQELFAAVKYYESQRQGLGAEFLDVIDSAISTIKEAPQRWPLIESGVRRYRLDRFPYHIVYKINGRVIAIIAVAHQHRKPGYWKNRED